MIQTSTERGKEKIERVRGSSLGKIIITDGIREIIQSFSGPSSYLPLCSLFHLPLSKSVRNTLFGKRRFTAPLMKSVETIRLFRWYCWLRKVLGFSKKGMICYVVLHVDCVSKADLNFYLYWGRKGKDWRPLKKGVVDNTKRISYGYICMTIWAEYFEYISINLVSPDYRNVLLSIKYGMWDRVDKYMKRGDARRSEEIIIHEINCHYNDMIRFVRGYDIQDALFTSYIYGGEVAEALLYEGILIGGMVNMGLYKGILQDTKKRSRIPTNALLDLFVSHTWDLERSTYPNKKDMCVAINDVASMFFGDLSTRSPNDFKETRYKRMYEDNEIDEIVRTLRGGERSMALTMLTLHVVERIVKGKGSHTLVEMLFSDPEDEYDMG